MKGSVEKKMQWVFWGDKEVVFSPLLSMTGRGSGGGGGSMVGLWFQLRGNCIEVLRCGGCVSVLEIQNGVTSFFMTTSDMHATVKNWMIVFLVNFLNKSTSWVS